MDTLEDTMTAPKTDRSPRGREPHSRVAYAVFNMRLTEMQLAELKRLRTRTGITIQAHIRRAILDYFHQLRKEQPELFTQG